MKIGNTLLSLKAKFYPIKNFYQMYLTISREILGLPFLEELIGAPVGLIGKRGLTQIGPSLKNAKGIIGWGFKDTAKKAINIAENYNLPYLALEDGFICSYGLRIKGYPPLSLIVDPVGIYYDATRPSFLEVLLKEKKFKKEELKEAERALNLVLEHNISKFNYQPMAEPSILKGKRGKKVLVIDQTYNDLSVKLGMANEESFKSMLESAIKENPKADIYVKIHPDVINKKKKGYLSEFAKESNRVYLISEDVNPLSLLKFFDKVYTVSSQMGFEALLLGKPVVCFGMPFYAGWGLTEDKLECSRRNKKLNLLELFCGAYIKYPRYINPVTGKKGNIFDVINFILKQREWAEKIGKYDYYCVDFHLPRRKFVFPYLKTERNKVYWVSSKDLTGLYFNKNSVIVVWGNRARKKLIMERELKIPIMTVEDGFIRSVGLGAEFIPPMSLVFDKKGIYYDPSKESDLEYILNNYKFSDDDIKNAERIRKLIIENDISKYNVDRLKKLAKPTNAKKVILVPGQVEDDEAVLLGGGQIKSNLDLLKTVRMKNPGAYIIYKPHPDVLSKNRREEKEFNKIREMADHIEIESNILSLIKIADEIHTLTSLSGFEALLRDKKVHTYGAPFYAGWGLTVDELDFPRRKRKLTLQELIAGVLLIYPLYYDWKLKGMADCETIIYRIIEERQNLKYMKNRYNFPRFFKKFANYINFLKWLWRRK